MHFLLRIKENDKSVFTAKGKNQRALKRAGECAQLFSNVQVQSNPGTTPVELRSDSAGTNYSHPMQSTF
jgi:hypothetical protein